MADNSLPQEVSDFFAEHPEIETFDAIFSDMNGVHRGKQIQKSGLGKLYDAGLNFPLGTHFLDVRGEAVDYDVPGSRDGDPDAFLRPIPGTLQAMPWAKRPSGQVLMTMYEQDGTPYFGDPRNVLLRALQPLRDMGLTPVIALELEFYLFKAKAGPPEPATSHHGIPAFTGPQVYNLDLIEDFDDFFLGVESACKEQGVPATAAISEYSDGQFELNLTHIDDAATACDHAFLLKRIVRSVAQKCGYVATFMAKPLQDVAGNGLHIHLSLLDKDGNNIFSETQATDGKSDFSDTLRHAIGGLSETMAEGMAIFSPNANSFRRFQPGHFAPVEPNWGPNHRDLSLRIPLSDAKNRRLEHRVAGADANPYLVTAAVMAGVHHGLTKNCDPGPMRHELEQIELETRLPVRWEAALDAFDDAKILPGYLGEEYARLYGICRRGESEKFQAEVSDRDYDWYLRAF